MNHGERYNVLKIVFLGHPVYSIHSTLHSYKRNPNVVLTYWNWNINLLNTCKIWLTLINLQQWLNLLLLKEKLSMQQLITIWIEQDTKMICHKSNAHYNDGSNASGFYLCAIASSNLRAISHNSALFLAIKFRNIYGLNKFRTIFSEVSSFVGKPVVPMANMLGKWIWTFDVRHRLVGDKMCACWAVQNVCMLGCAKCVHAGLCKGFNPGGGRYILLQIRFHIFKTCKLDKSIKCLFYGLHYQFLVSTRELISPFFLKN